MTCDPSVPLLIPLDENGDSTICCSVSHHDLTLLRHHESAGVLFKWTAADRTL